MNPSDPALHEVLTLMVDSSSTREELDARVTQSYGRGLLSQAYEIAKTRKGIKWLEVKQVRQPLASGPEFSDVAWPVQSLDNILRKQPSLIVLLAAAVLIVLVVLFPPFVVHLPQGLTTNAGFSFILSPPTIGQLSATVNVSLLAIEVLVVLVATAAIYAVAHTIEGKAARW